MSPANRRTFLGQIGSAAIAFPALGRFGAAALSDQLNAERADRDLGSLNPDPDPSAHAGGVLTPDMPELAVHEEPAVLIAELERQSHPICSK